METAPQATIETTEDLHPIQQTSQSPPEEPAPLHHWDAATAIQPYTQPKSMPTPPPQIQTNTQPTHQQPPTPLQATAPTQSSTEAQLAALIQLISQQTMVQAQRDETLNQAVATIAVSVSTIQTDVRQMGHELRTKVQQISNEMTALSTHVDQRLTASEHRQGQTIDALTKRIENLEQQPGPRKQRKIEPQQQPQQSQITDTTATPTQLTHKPTPQQLYQTEMTQHN